MLELRLCHVAGYVELVRMLSDSFMVEGLDRSKIFEAGFASEDNPIVQVMHQAAATVVGGSLAAAESVDSGAALHGDDRRCEPGVQHAPAA